MKPFLDELESAVLIGDGAIGTALFARGATPEEGVELMNLTNPDVVLQLHRDYVAAGSRVIETNTFGANAAGLAAYGVDSESKVREIIVEGVRLAFAASAHDTYLAGSLGPLPAIEGESMSPEDQAALFAQSITALVEGGVDLLMLESFASLDELLIAVRTAKSITDLPVVAQAAFGSEGYTADGHAAVDVARRCIEAGADVVGANCGYGVSSIVKAIREMGQVDAPMSAYLNAGFPERVEGRLMYLASPEYLASRALDLVGMGVRLIGGCCGTDPDTIRHIAEAVTTRRAPRVHPRAVPAVTVTTPPPSKPPARPVVGEYPLLVELDPPRSLDIQPLIDAARDLKAAGATAITLADNPLASVRVDNFAVAGIIQHDVELPVVPHLTGRDRNRIAIQSTIMGAHVLGIRSILCVTGDPVRMCQEPNTSGVFDLTSVGLVRMVADFNEGHRLTGDCRTEFAIGVALNPNVRTVSGQVDKLRRKVDVGAHFALTQPIFDEQRLDTLQNALLTAGIDIPIYIGILPLVSARNAEFLHNEVPGILIPDEIREAMRRHEAVADQFKTGIEIASNLVSRLAPRVDGFYFICPRNRVEAIAPLVGCVRRGV